MITGIIAGSLVITSATVFLESSDIALAKRKNQSRYIDGKWYTFYSNGYWV